MDKAMNIFRRMLSGMDRQYLVKTYFFSIVLTFLFFMSIDSNTSAFMYIYIVVCGLLFPFATVVWDDFISTIMGTHIFILPLLIMLMWKLFKLLMLFIFTPLIAPIGFIYIYIGNGYHKKDI